MKQIFLRLGIVLFFMSGTLYVTDQFKNLQKIILLAGIFFLLVAGGKIRSKISFVYGFTSLRILYILFVSSLLISAIYTGELSELISAGGMVLIGLAGIRWFPCAICNNQYSYHSAVNVVFACQALFLLYCIISDGITITSRSYEGVFSNPNAFGGAVATFFATALMVYSYAIKNGNLKKLKQAFMILMLLASFLFVLLSNSRTSFVCIMVSFAFFVLVLLRNAVGNKQKKIQKRAASILLLLIIAFVVLLLFTDLNLLIKDTILSKFDAKIDDPLSGRTEKWTVVLERTKLFGNGESASISAHNTFLGLLDQYGILAGLLWSLLIIKGLFLSVKRTIFQKNCNATDYIPLFSFLAFFILSLAEGMMLKTVMLMMVFSIPLLEPIQKVES